MDDAPITIGDVDALRRENPGIFADVKQLHDRIVADANANASPVTGFKFRVGIEEGRVTNVGVKASSSWVDGFPITLSLEGPARFNSTNTKTWTGNSQAAERTPAWTRTGPGQVKVTAVVTDLPDTK